MIDHFDSGTRDALRKFLSVWRRNKPILLSPYHECGRLDTVNAFVQALVGNRPDEFAGTGHRPDHLDLSVDVGLAERHPGNRTVGFIEQILRQVGRGRDEHPVGNGRLLSPETDRAYQYQLTDAFGII